jgi:hypothetical protein
VISPKEVSNDDPHDRGLLHNFVVTPDEIVVVVNVELVLADPGLVVVGPEVVVVNPDDLLIGLDVVLIR